MVGTTPPRRARIARDGLATKRCVGGRRYRATVTKAGVLGGSKSFHWLWTMLPWARSMSAAPCAHKTVMALACSDEDAALTATSIPDFLGGASSGFAGNSR